MPEDSFQHVSDKCTLYQGSYLSLHKMNIHLPDGRKGIREIVHVRDSVAILPITEDSVVHLVKQYRHAVEKTMIEIPAGLLDQEESLKDAAVRECEEETGYRPHKLEKLITYAHAEGYSTGFMTLFLGTDLEFTGKTHMDATEHIEPVNVPFKTLLRWVQENRIYDSKTLLSVHLVKNRYA
jgi:ADP-ribose pyrophosphatase